MARISRKTLIKFLNLVSFVLYEGRFPTSEEIMEHNDCCRGTAYYYLRALRYLFSGSMLGDLNNFRWDGLVQQASVNT